MAKSIIELNTGCQLSDIIQQINLNNIKKYILSEHPRTKLERIVFISNLIQDKLGVNPSIEIKYTYGMRNKRFEIVFKIKNSIYIGKISNGREFDKDAIEINTILNDINTLKYENVHFIGILFLSDYDELLLSTFLLTLNNKVKFIKISEIQKEGILLNVISN